MNEERDKFMEEYAKQHACCPKCGSKNYTTTLAAYVFDHQHPEEYEDKNRVTCQVCGYKGSRHSLVPENPDVDPTVVMLESLVRKQHEKIDGFVRDQDRFMEDVSKLCSAVTSYMEQNVSPYFMDDVKDGIHTYHGSDGRDWVRVRLYNDDFIIGNNDVHTIESGHTWSLSQVHIIMANLYEINEKLNKFESRPLEGKYFVPGRDRNTLTANFDDLTVSMDMSGANLKFRECRRIENVYPEELRHWQGVCAEPIGPFKVGDECYLSRLVNGMVLVVGGGGFDPIRQYLLSWEDYGKHFKIFK